MTSISPLEYCSSLQKTLADGPWDEVQALVDDLRGIRNNRQQVFLCGNGGSAANALHLAIDLLYGAGRGLRAHALPANPAVLTCLGNDLSYEAIFASQLRVAASPGDLLIVFSGSGNSPNILRALEAARDLQMSSWAVLGFDGGRALGLADKCVHFPVNDMQVAEDCQMVLGHILTRALKE